MGRLVARNGSHLPACITIAAVALGQLAGPACCSGAEPAGPAVADSLPAKDPMAPAADGGRSTGLDRTVKNPLRATDYSVGHRAGDAGSDGDTSGPMLELHIGGRAEEGLRRFVRKEIEKAFPNICVFGSYLDAIVASIEPVVTNIPDTLTITFRISVPSYFFADSMSFRMHVSSREKVLRVYGDSLLLVEERVGMGDYWMDEKERERNFTTRAGMYYINRVVRDPWWYPPRWADRDEPVPPGPENPLGSWMAELCRDSIRAGYGFAASKQATRMRLHGTHTAVNNELSPTHGCVRINNATQEEFCSALLRYCPHDSARVTSRGTVIPLVRPIRIEIGE